MFACARLSALTPLVQGPNVTGALRLRRACLRAFISYHWVAPVCKSDPATDSARGARAAGAGLPAHDGPGRAALVRGRGAVLPAGRGAGRGARAPAQRAAARARAPSPPHPPTSGVCGAARPLQNPQARRRCSPPAPAHVRCGAARAVMQIGNQRRRAAGPGSQRAALRLRPCVTAPARGGRAQIERMRLAAGGASRMAPSREQQRLHFQWFADLGSPEAQRALGQLLSQGAARDPAQALRYFRCGRGALFQPYGPSSTLPRRCTASGAVTGLCSGCIGAGRAQGVRRRAAAARCPLPRH